jgi:hypothetical protein
MKRSRVNEALCCGVMSGDLGYRDSLSLFVADRNTMSEFVPTFETLAGGVLSVVYVALLILETVDDRSCWIL